MSQPAFSIRGFNPCESLLRHTPEQLRRFLQRMKILKMNSIIIHYDYGWNRYKNIILEETKKAGVEITMMTFGPRTFFSYVDWKAEWFAKKEDGSNFTSLLECETQPCRFQFEGIEAFTYGAKKWLRELPKEIVRVHMRASDGLHFCQCEQCRSLPDHEKWQPFVEIFEKAVTETRPNLSFEVDVYVKRYNLPNNLKSHQKMGRIMYDTFYRHNHVPIGMPSPNKELVKYAATERQPDASSPNEYHENRLKEWCKTFPDKVYIHENAMAQSLQGVFQHNTEVMIKDLELYRKLGVQGIMYEAYEPGFDNFSEHFSILADAMWDLDKYKDYSATLLEKELNLNYQRGTFCSDGNFPLGNYIDNPVRLEHVEHYRRCKLELSAENYRKYTQFAFKHSDSLDVLFISFFNAKVGIEQKKLNFSYASKEAQSMLKYAMLWDFMEKVPSDKSPIEEVKRLIIDLMENVK
jgi:hypothetical protein